MSDFKDRTFGPDYLGPEDRTIMDHITMFGQRSRITYAELRQQFGQDWSWPNRKENFSQKLERMQEEGKIKKFEIDGTLYYSVVGFKEPSQEQNRPPGRWIPGKGWSDRTSSEAPE
jgi:hypothetical protein